MLHKFLSRPGARYAVCLSAALTLLAGTAGANSADIYKDIENDAPADAEHAVRIKLKKQPALPMGRLAGVWGAVGEGDGGDAFLLGKTHEPMRIQISLSTPERTPPVELRIYSDGKMVEKLAAERGNAVTRWLKIKGKVTVNIKPTAPAPAGLYAAYFWYPGDVANGLSDAEFEQVRAGKTPLPTAFVRRGRDTVDQHPE